MNKKRTEILFLIIYTIYIMNQVLSESQFINIGFIKDCLSVTRYLVFGSLICLIIYKETYKNKIKLISVIFILVFVVLNLVAADGGISLLMIMLFVLASQGNSLQALFKVSIIIMIIMHLLVMGCAYVGILEDSVEYRYIGNLSGSFFIDIYNRFSGAYNRHSMGFLVHNQMALSFFCVYLMYIVYKRECISWYENVVIMILNIIIFNYFGSRLIFIINIAVCAGYYAIRLIDKVSNKKICVLWLCYPICTMLSFVTALQYNPYNPLSLKLDMFFNNRLRLAKEALDFYGLGIIGSGQYAGTYNSTVLLENTVDNGYIAIFIQTGVVVAMAMIAIWAYLTYIAEKNNNWYLMLALVALALENLLNSHLCAYKMIPFLCILMNTNDLFVKGAVRKKRICKINYSWRL